jgi:hypothetical protein
MSHMERRPIDQTMRPIVKHITSNSIINANDVLEFKQDFNVPFAVRRVDISFIVKDDQKTPFPLVLRITGLTDGHSIASPYNEYSKTFSIFYNPPRNFQGSHLVEFLELNVNGDLDSAAAPHDGALVINYAFYNEV